MLHLNCVVSIISIYLSIYLTSIFFIISKKESDVRDSRCSNQYFNHVIPPPYQAQISQFHLVNTTLPTEQSELTTIMYWTGLWID